ncbi:GNAT family N-acetyltransferase [Thalassorhabdomicrobium marinisediminis]|uniref:GNAT family N-acetyltransferase n=1 Tax=Thalassorhabdomicrobium marinisediminis TaxID=2170577 RepID=A0A2T7FXV5_9RHOB|nr:GNAT family N-acetyltransferase [Thalassorhabdomicrobium marinisediminis]PVA07002.1 GNAT family N-acetyltransferase [Thalassorhabdomicrobium marinisediminis]
MIIRPATAADWPALWDILRPVFRAGETYAVDRDIDESAARALWCDSPAATFVAEDAGRILGTYYLKTNHQGGARHVCNCGYVTDATATGRGVARAMCEHSLAEARAMGYRAMQFNLVLASNAAAVGLWQKLGFQIVGTLPQVFDHPRLGLVDGHVMWKALS